MANITTAIRNWSGTASSNQPDSTDTNTIAADLQALGAGVRNLYVQDTISSATTCDIGAKDAGSLTVSGITTITSFGTVSAGIRKILTFSGAMQLTYNATSMILPGDANITTVAGDTAEFESLGSGNWLCLWYTRQAGTPLVGGVTDGDKGDITVSSSGATYTIDNDVVTYAKMQNVSATSRVLGRKTAAAGDTEECTLSEVLDFIGSAAQGDILYRGASAWARLGAGTSGQFLKTMGAGANPEWGAASATLATQQATTSGTSIDFTSIPAGTKRITVMLNGVSTNGTSNVIIQIGDSGGLETTNYLGTCSTITGGAQTDFTSGFMISNSHGATVLLYGSVDLTLMDSSTNTWAAHFVLGSGAGSGRMGGGIKALSATLDRLSLTTANGTDAFDAGAINILYS